MYTNRITFLADFWRLAKPYWTSEERWAARGLLAVIVAMNLGMVYINVLFNAWNGAFYNALQNRDEAEFTTQIMWFCVLAAIYIVVAVYQLYLNQMLQIRWRRWLTDRMLGEWLADRAYYRLQFTDYNTDNPDQRIAEDIRMFVADTLSLSLGLLSSVVTLVSFIGILWALSGPITLTLGGHAFDIPGYMVWVAIVYAIVGSWLTHRLGWPLVRLNFDQQRYEADFRFGLIRFRENAEGVALYGGETGEARTMMDRFEQIRQNWWAIMRRQKLLTFFTVGFSQVAVVFPILVAAPRYFSGAIELGGLMQIAQAFGQVQGALSWFVDAYVRLTDWKATVDRLTGFRRALEAVHADARAAGRIRVVPHDGADLCIDDLRIDLPGGRVLIDPTTLDLEPGRAVLLTGPSGSGKSTLFRALAGIWPFGSGRVDVPRDARVLFLPQKPYLPIDTLRAAVSYPAPPGRFDDEAIAAALEDARLPTLADRIDERRHWAQELSPGEQQRLAVARALLHRPDWLFLDEATSALDETTENALHRVLRDKLPDTTLVSIAHRPSVSAFHDRHLVLERDEHGHGRLILKPPPAGAGQRSGNEGSAVPA
jgi:putative ATP-binding cassette transporter